LANYHKSAGLVNAALESWLLLLNFGESFYPGFEFLQVLGSGGPDTQWFWERSYT
jgi:hypothetical protein